MSEKMKYIFNKEKNIVIGAIHFPPLVGYPDFPGLEVALKNALLDLHALEEGGVDAVIVENNYDIPHVTFVTDENREVLTYLSQKIKAATKLPVGISVLWNDYKTALSISKKLGLLFIRVPVFVDKVKTNYGIMEPKADEVIAFRKEIGAEEVAIFADIHVKHSEILSPFTISESAQLAIQKGADALIITGRWTGDAPDTKELEEVRNTVGNFPIICGSGVDSVNIKDLFKFSTGAIVSTSLKEGNINFEEVNMKGYEQRIDIDKVRKLFNSIVK
jgi:membrane complex biogenesis BtpA family protein